GPALLGPAGRFAAALGLATDSGAFLMAGGCAVLALLFTAWVPGGHRPRLPSAGPAARPFDRPAARRALLALAAAQVIMVAVMTATPMNMHMHGSEATSIGAVLSAHTFGMFAFSPVTGA